jgi:hypothetical protein
VVVVFVVDDVVVIDVDDVDDVDVVDDVVDVHVGKRMMMRAHFASFFMDGCSDKRKSGKANRLSIQR